jgi:hypothetical protein
MPQTNPLRSNCAHSDAYRYIPLHLLVHTLQDYSMLFKNALLQ